MSNHPEKWTGKLPQMNNKLCSAASVLFTLGPHRDLYGSKAGHGLGIARKQPGDGGRTGPPALDARATYTISVTSSSPITSSPSCQFNCCRLDSISSSAPPVTLSFCLLALYQLQHPCIHVLTQCSHTHCCLLTSYFPRLPTYLTPAPFHTW